MRLPETEQKMLPLASLRPAGYNPQRMTERQKAELRASIQEFGMVIPIVVNRDLTIIGGHHRVEAALELGIQEGMVLIMDLPSHLERALNLALNQIDGEWDPLRLRALLEEIAGDGVDPALVGFNAKEIVALVGQAQADVASAAKSLANTKDDAPAAADQSPPVSEFGKLYELGPHRLVCGDSRDPILMEGLLGEGAPVDLWFTDPPYNVAYKSAVRGAIMNDDLDEEQFEALMYGVFVQANRRMRPGAAAYICTGHRSAITFMQILKTFGWPIDRSVLVVWAKESINLSRRDYHPQHECILFSWRPGAEPVLSAGRDMSNTWTIHRASRNNMVHPTEKPVALIEKAIRTSTTAGALVLDTFAGSGSTMEACHLTGRVARLIEVDPRHCDSIRRRARRLLGDAAKDGLAPVVAAR